MPRNRFHATLAVLLLTLAAADVGAQRAAAPAAEPPQAEQPQTGQQPIRRAEVTTADLGALLQRLERQTNKPFVVDRRLGTQIYLGGVEPNDVTYPVLLAILRTMGFAAAEVDGRINIVPDAEIRFYPTPIVQGDDESILADEFVTRIVTTANIDPPQLVPILRPMMAQAAHLAAVPPNKLVLMDRYANVKRITEVIRILDAAPRN